MLSENSPAPEFKAQDQNGKWHSLKDYAGKWVLLYFYPKDDTPGCRREACEFRDHFGDLKKKAIVLGVSHDTVVSHKKFGKKYGLPFLLLSDPEKKIIRDYEAKGFLFTKRISYLIDPQGSIAKAYDKVSPSRHAQQVLEDLEKFGA